MKDQYVGDVNDYLKYALVREVQRHRRGGLLVGWMLTSNDGGNDGSRLGYLDNPSRYRGGDPELFDALTQIIASRRRSVLDFEAEGLVPRARYYCQRLGANLRAREDYFSALAEQLAPDDLLLLTPDNGFQVASVKAGQRGSERYLFWHELRGLASGCSAVVYQHYSRKPRSQIADELLARAAAELPGHVCLALAGPRALYLFAAHPAHAQELRRAKSALVSRWPENLRAIG